MIFLLLSLTLVSTSCAYSADQAFGMTNGTMFYILAMIPGVVLCSLVRGYLFDKLRYTFGDHNGSAKPSKDPTQYLDPYGSLCGIAFGFCWAKLPNYYPRHFNKPISNEIYLYVSLSLANLAIAGISLSLYLLTVDIATQIPHALQITLSTVLYNIFKINIMTALFSFAPIYGLPGYLLIIRHLDYRTVFKLQDYLSLTIFIGILCLIFGTSFFNSVIAVFASFALIQGKIPLLIVSILALIFLVFIQFKVLQKD